MKKEKAKSTKKWSGFGKFATEWLKADFERAIAEINEEEEHPILESRVPRHREWLEPTEEERPILVTLEPTIERVQKEDKMKRLVMSWVEEHNWICVVGHENIPPDLFTTNLKKIKGVEVASQRIASNGFEISMTALENEDTIFVIVIETEENKFANLVLTRDEMAKECEGKPLDGNRYGLSASRKLKGWEQYKNKWDKLER